jgi:hypothetical protein
MVPIVAGRFDNISQTEKLRAELSVRGIPPEDISLFHVNPPGQHGAFPIGGDQHKDPGAKDADKSAGAGAAAGAAVGLAGAVAGPVGAVAGVAVGAYTGAFSGALGGMNDDKYARPSGVMVAIRVPDSEYAESAAFELLERHGAQDIEKAHGTWQDGEWKDFNPLAPPQLLLGRPTTD